MPRSRRCWMMLLIAALVLAIDQGSKWYAVHELQGEPPASYLGDLFRVQYAENSGAFLSLLAGMSASVRFAVLTVANGLVLLGVVAYSVTRTALDRWSFYALALIAAGGIGNLIDRIFNEGRVIDFLNMGVGSVRTGIFNVADMAIMAGFFMLLAQMIWPATFSDVPADAEAANETAEPAGPTTASADDETAAESPAA